MLISTSESRAAARSASYVQARGAVVPPSSSAQPSSSPKRSATDRMYAWLIDSSRDGAGGAQRRGVDLLDEEHLVAEVPEPEQVLKHRPGRAAVMRDGGDHAAHDDAQAIAGHGLRPASARKRGSTLSESNRSSASARAAARWPS